METKRKVSIDEVIERSREIKRIFEDFMKAYLFILDSVKHVEIEDALSLTTTLNYISDELQKRLRGAYTHLFFNSETQVTKTNNGRIIRVIDTHRVEDGRTEKTYLVKTAYRIIEEGQGKTTSVRHVLEDVDVLIKELVNENTPFTQILQEKLSLYWFKEPWRTEVINTLYDLAKAEREDRLDEELNKVIDKAESEPVLENKLLLNAIMRAKKEYDEFMRKLRSGQMP